MKVLLKMLFASVILIACNKGGLTSHKDVDFEFGKDLTHEMIVLGERLDNPYTVENMSKALAHVCPSKAGRDPIDATNIYARFLPEDEAEYNSLLAMGVTLMDHPLDYAIAVEGDWYHDPAISDDDYTWQYAVLPMDFEFPDIRYEIIDECFIPENSSTKASDVDWQEVERQAFILTGNESMLSDAAMTKSSGNTPSGRITIVDESYNGGKPMGVAGVRVSANVFVKFDKTYTDRDGYYTMSKKFSGNPRYRLVFKNEKGFSIGFNFIIVPASVSTLGKAGPEGITCTITKNSESKLFKRCVVNNAAYDYISRCSKEDLDIAPPPSDLRIWIFHNLRASSAVMLHHGAFIENELLSRYLGIFTKVIAYFLPDLTIGAKDIDTYETLYTVVQHELAHTSHYATVGNEYWDKYIFYILESFVKDWDNIYGDGSSENAGYCAIGEMWAYFMEAKLHKERYGGTYVDYGTSYWFHPQIFRYLTERGLSASDIFDVLMPEVNSVASLKIALLSKYPSRRIVIEQIFSRYGY